MDIVFREHTFISASIAVPFRVCVWGGLKVKLEGGGVSEQLS